MQSFANGYNYTRHSTIDMTPFNVFKTKEEEMRLAIYMPKKKSTKKLKRYIFVSTIETRF